MRERLLDMHAWTLGLTNISNLHPATRLTRLSTGLLGPSRSKYWHDRHMDPNYHTERGLKVWRLKLPNFDYMRKQQENKMQPNEINPRNKAPVKFTTSKAYLDYKATENFYGGDTRDLPESHNYVLAASMILGFFYLIFLRDDIEDDGGMKLFKPLHETVPQLAIPLLQSTIVENRRHGLDTSKLEAKLADYLKDPEQHGLKKPKLVEN